MTAFDLTEVFERFPKTSLKKQGENWFYKEQFKLSQNSELLKRQINDVSY